MGDDADRAFDTGKSLPLIRVGFVAVGVNADWMGGTIYLANLVHAIASLPAPRIEPVLVTGPEPQADLLKLFPKIDTIRTPLVIPRSAHKGLRRVSRILLHSDPMMERLLKRHGIELLSHSGNLGPRTPVPVLEWIPDFQHRRLPEFFSGRELALRDRTMRAACANAALVILSSRDAQRDLEECFPAAASKSRVLRFVAGLGAARDDEIPLTELCALYGISGAYFHLPNQFWAHKNHGVVADALALLRKRGRDVLVLATGRTHDGRQPDYFRNLMQRVSDLGVADLFRVLGMVPYGHVASLMRHAVAVMNPSVFEGWSTTVEEAKSLGKSVVLSDIAIHREQNPEWGTFFEARSPESLAGAMVRAADSHSHDADLHRQTEAQKALRNRVAEFAMAYEDIVLEACAIAGSRRKRKRDPD